MYKDKDYVFQNTPTSQTARSSFGGCLFIMAILFPTVPVAHMKSMTSFIWVGPGYSTPQA